MAGKKSSKRSTIYSKGTNATIDQFFTVKRKSIENNSTSANENETNITSSALPSGIYKQQERNPKLSSQPISTKLSDKKGTDSLNIKRQRRPLADIGGESAQALTLMPTRKPAKPSFTVLRDDDIDQGATQSIKHETQTQSPLPSPLNIGESNTQHRQQQSIITDNTTQEETTTTLDDNDDDDDDTQDSQASSSVGSGNSLQSFFDDDHSDNGIEFRVDALDSDNDDDDSNSDDDATTSFFDDGDSDDDDAPFLTKTHRRTHLPAAAAAAAVTPTTTTTSPLIPNKSTLSSKNEGERHNNQINKSNVNEGILTPIPSANAEDKDDQIASKTLEFSISNSLTIPLDIKDNYHSSSEEENDDDDSRPETQAIPTSTESTADTKPSPVISNQQGPSNPTSPQVHRTQSPPTSELSTLPMSPSAGEALDLHVAYPVPRGEHVIDKFGH